MFPLTDRATHFGNSVFLEPHPFRQPQAVLDIVPLRILLAMVRDLPKSTHFLILSQGDLSPFPQQPRDLRTTGWLKSPVHVHSLQQELIDSFPFSSPNNHNEGGAKSRNLPFLVGPFSFPFFWGGGAPIPLWCPSICLSGIIFL